MIKWMPLFAQTLLPLSPEIYLNVPNLVDRLVTALKYGSKGQQIFHISVFKSFVHNYLSDEA